MVEITNTPGPRLFISNRLEVLADYLAAIIATPLSSPLKTEVIVVQSKGMERWISMQLAGKHGICANCRFPFPNAVLHDLFRAVDRSPQVDTLFEPDHLTWRLMKVLPHCLTRPEFEAIRTYLENDNNGLKLFQLSQRIADTFDQYLLFRPQMVLEWEQGRENHWQALVWRILIEQKTGVHRAAIRERFFYLIDRLDGAVADFPERISVFGISTLPRFHLEVLARINRLIPVHLFLLNPCREYWGDIVTHRESRRIRRKYDRGEQSGGDLHLEKGNSLLASLGTLGRDFFDFVYSFDCEETDLFVETVPETLLSRIQRDILTLQERDGSNECLVGVAPEDDSLQIHSCHSPMREVEVLYDTVLGMFDQDPTLQPEDILVMTPRIEEYTPFIQAVFESPPSEDVRIPYNITDRTMRSGSQTARSFLAILELSTSRFTASEMMTILEAEPVYTSFSLTQANVEMIKHWIEAAGIRWGIDENTRQEEGLPSYRDNTWRFGLQRLLLGYALPGNNENLFHHILPFDHVEGEGAVVMGKFVECVERLFDVAVGLRDARSLGEWSETLTLILERFFAGSAAGGRELQTLYGIVNDLAKEEELSTYGDDVDPAVVFAYIRQQCDRRQTGSGFMSGGITFCTVLPMRSIPFSVICLLGMNNNAYPRPSRPVSFDLMARHPLPGDRSRRNDDRYLFLEALLSARKKIYISYLGQSLKDNSVIPPSVVVSELLDYVAAGFTANKGSVIDQVLHKHPLQSFSARYFSEEEGLFSYSEENCRAARRTAEERTVTPFISSGLSASGDNEWASVSVDGLCRFFRNPVQYLLVERLGLYLDDTTSVTADREPFDVTGLERYSLDQRILEKRLSGESLESYLAVSRAAGTLPPGTVGARLYEKVSGEVDRFASAVVAVTRSAVPESMDVDFDIGPFKVSGTIRGMFPHGLVAYRCATIRSKDYLDLWIKHLVLAMTDRITETCRSWYVGLEKRKPAAFEYMPVARGDGEQFLAPLLACYRRGLTEPLHFFPESSLAYAEAVVIKEKSDQEGINAAAKEWQGDDFYRGEGDDLYYRQCFGSESPLDETFKKTALEVFGPLLEHRKKLSVVGGP